jgi:hypothetical protein
LAIRLVLVALAVVAVGVAAHALHADHRCAQIRADASTVPVRELPAVAHATAERCGDPRDRAAVAVIAFNRGRRSTGIALARRMTATTPDDYVGWFVLWRLTGDRNAQARAHELNPRGSPPQ